jgi:hypothetical protein
MIDTVQCTHIQIMIVQRETTRNFVMARKPTHEELEQRVKEVEKGTTMGKEAQAALGSTHTKGRVPESTDC